MATNYALSIYAVTHPELHARAKEKFQAAGLRGCFGIPNLRKVYRKMAIAAGKIKSKYEPGNGVGQPTPTGEIVNFTTGPMVRYSDGSLRDVPVVKGLSNE